jgi:hypothetical protein
MPTFLSKKSRSCRFTALLPSPETSSEKKDTAPALRGIGLLRLRIHTRQQQVLASENQKVGPISLRSCERPILPLLTFRPLTVPALP